MGSLASEVLHCANCDAILNRFTNGRDPRETDHLQRLRLTHREREREREGERESAATTSFHRERERERERVRRHHGLSQSQRERVSERAHRFWMGFWVTRLLN